MTKVPINLESKPLIDPSKFVFSFGKYKGEKFKDVLNDDANYLVWCIERIDWFVVDEDTKDLIEDEASEQEEKNDVLSEITYPYW